MGGADSAERQEGEPGLTRLHTIVAAADFLEDALQVGGGRGGALVGGASWWVGGASGDGLWE